MKYCTIQTNPNRHLTAAMPDVENIILRTHDIDADVIRELRLTVAEWRLLNEAGLTVLKEIVKEMQDH